MVNSKVLGFIPNLQSFFSEKSLTTGNAYLAGWLSGLIVTVAIVGLIVLGIVYLYRKSFGVPGNYLLYEKMETGELIGWHTYYKSSGKTDELEEIESELTRRGFHDHSPSDSDASVWSTE